MLDWLHRGKDWAAVGAEDRDHFIARGEQVPEFGAQDEGLSRLQLHAEQAGIRGDGGRAFGTRTKDSERHGEILSSAGSPSKDNLWGVSLGLFLFGHLGLGRPPFVACLSPDTTQTALMRPYYDSVTTPKPFALGWRLLRICGWTLLAVVGLPLSFYGFLHSNHNQHEVVPGLLYRSAQLPAGEFISLAKQTGLRTVINLRGENVGSDWYDAQYRAAKELGVGFLNYRMSASRELTVEQMTELAQILRAAPKPVLIHCGSGSDRTGLACA